MSQSILASKTSAEMTKKLHANLVFVAELSRQDKLFGFEIMNHVHLHDLSLVLS